MPSSLDLAQKQQHLLDLIYENELVQLMDLVPTLPTLNFIDLESFRTPLGLAVRVAEEEVIEYLLLQGADPDFASKHTLPLLAAIERSVESDKYWVDMNDSSKAEEPLVIVELLLRYGADFTKKDPQGRTAYEFALTERHLSWRLFEQLTRGAADPGPARLG